jgi:hypothetical protein
MSQLIGQVLREGHWGFADVLCFSGRRIRLLLQCAFAGLAPKPISRPSPDSGIYKEYSEGVTMSNRRNRAKRTDATVSQAKQALIPAEREERHANEA